MRTSLKLLFGGGVVAFLAFQLACGSSSPTSPVDAGKDAKGGGTGGGGGTAGGGGGGTAGGGGGGTAGGGGGGTNMDAGTDASDASLPTGNIDRMGRPAINTALNFMNDPTKDKYNQELSFQTWATNTTYDLNFNNNLHYADTLGGDQVDWPLNDAGAGPWGDAGMHPLLEALKLDVLFVDIGKNCTTAANNFCVGGYLEIEANILLNGPAWVTCGGRTPAEDVMTKTLTLLITAGRQLPNDGGVAVVSDNVAAATKPPTMTFPYLAAPN